MNNSYLGLGDGSNSLLSQAIAPNSGRLQKFFGVSHIKIDPQLTDVTIVPQARLTMEQQVSSDVTLTYITNLEVSQPADRARGVGFQPEMVGGGAAR